MYYADFNMCQSMSEIVRAFTSVLRCIILCMKSHVFLSMSDCANVLRCVIIVCVHTCGCSHVDHGYM